MATIDLFVLNAKETMSKQNTASIAIKNHVWKYYLTNKFWKEIFKWTLTWFTNTQLKSIRVWVAQRPGHLIEIVLKRKFLTKYNTILLKLVVRDSLSICQSLILFTSDFQLNHIHFTLLCAQAGNTDHLITSQYRNFVKLFGY